MSIKVIDRTIVANFEIRIWDKENKKARTISFWSDEELDSIKDKVKEYLLKWAEEHKSQKEHKAMMEHSKK